MVICKRLFLMILTALVTVSLCSTGTFAATSKKKSQPNNRYASIVMDAETGQILSQSNADKKLYPASLTKIMTLVLTFEALESGRLTLRDRVPMSQRAVNMSPSKIGLPVGASMRVEDAIYALVTKSANDVAVALAEKVGGTESQFAIMMTRKAREIGMTNTRFVNASGWHDPAQVSTARDMAKLGRYVIYRYPQYYHYFGTRNFTFQGKSYHNHNRLMSQYKGMDGLKTGYVGASGFNLVASAKRGNKRLVGVVFGGRSAASRNAHMASLLDRGFQGIDTSGSADYVAAVAIKPPPVPGRKPLEVLVASTTPVTATARTVQSIAPAAGAAVGQQTPQYNPTPFTSFGALAQNDGLNEILGQGDFDPAAERRVETGLMAVAAVKKEPYQRPVWSTSTAAAAPVDSATPGLADQHESLHPWAIQIGAFTSRVQTDKALKTAMNTLPSSLTQNIEPIIVPLKTTEGWMFRARLSGYTKDSAARACTLLRECLTVSPEAAR
ncbi:MAG: D-alanyl-D-alanine carboxypeptidase [Micavibrio aeruginosavorus]|uniref:D-alanyl-D-alanine carboxypeptidase n=1 Tax=Micavibrio aeruginosavorus TaxID=349221 RepID=A0A7T5UGQ4_9BACT|nr:MAG: D-alanyl-D-alanine carboxypeptidase [Micavibrio aeruginosavorus]